MSPITSKEIEILLNPCQQINLALSFLQSTLHTCYGWFLSKFLPHKTIHGPTLSSIPHLMCAINYTHYPSNSSYFSFPNSSQTWFAWEHSIPCSESPDSLDWRSLNLCLPITTFMPPILAVFIETKESEYIIRCRLLNHHLDFRKNRQTQQLKVGRKPILAQFMKMKISLNSIAPLKYPGWY